MKLIYVSYRASYASDWGDYISFALRMREKATSQGQDLLLIDTGDRVEGSGLYDSSEPQGVYLSPILKEQHVDVICSGNHELYKQNTSEREYLTTVPNFRDNYLASNIDIIDPHSHELVPLARRYRKFTTEAQGIRIVAFGFLLDFTGNYNNTIVQSVRETIKEAWFQEAIHDENVDLFLVIGHVPVHSPEYSAIFQEIRSLHPDTPIQFFGGHLHIRDFAKYDSRSYGLASGRFMETIGFLSINGLRTVHNTSKITELPVPSFSRRYIDNNLYSFFHHTNLNESTFHTAHGKNVSRMITEAREKLALDEVHGCAPKDLWMSRVPYRAPDSIFTWLEEFVLPGTLYKKSHRKEPAVAIANTGAIRFDIFKGPFTQDSAFLVSPFTSGFRFVPNIPVKKVNDIIEILNKAPKVLSETSRETSTLLHLAPPEQIGRSQPTFNNEQTLVQHDRPSVSHEQTPFIAPDESQPLIFPGYTTVDQMGSDGDDTIHSPITFYNVPNVISAFVPGRHNSSRILPDTSGTVDLVYIDFIEQYMSLAAKFAGLDIDFKHSSEVYLEGETLTTLILDWIKENWKCHALDHRRRV